MPNSRRLEGNERAQGRGVGIDEPDADANTFTAPWPFTDHSRFLSRASDSQFAYAVVLGFLLIFLDVFLLFTGVLMLLGFAVMPVAMYYDSYYLRAVTEWGPNPTLFGIGTLLIPIVFVPYWGYRRYELSGRRAGAVDDVEEANDPVEWVTSPTVIIDEILARSASSTRELTILNIGDESVDLRGAKIVDALNDLYRIGIDRKIGVGGKAKFEIPPEFVLAPQRRLRGVQSDVRVRRPEGRDRAGDRHP